MKKEICNNCLLYDREKSTCKVKIIYEGKLMELPVLPGDSCFWKENDLEINQIRSWSDGRNGYIESPGDPDDED
jgi:hypothetical protein